MARHGRGVARHRPRDQSAPRGPILFCPIGVASTTTGQPCSRATIWAKQNQNRFKTKRDMRMRDISRREGNLKREALWGGGDSLVIRLPKILVLTRGKTKGTRVRRITRLPRILVLIVLGGGGYSREMAITV